MNESSDQLMAFNEAASHTMSLIPKAKATIDGFTPYRMMGDSHGTDSQYLVVR